MSKVLSEPHCCPGCGRDTTSAFCPACTAGISGRRRNHDGERGRHRSQQQRWPEDVFDDDRYDEESGPDDVFDDGNLAGIDPEVARQVVEIVTPSFVGLVLLPRKLHEVSKK